MSEQEQTDNGVEQQHGAPESAGYPPVYSHVPGAPMYDPYAGAQGAPHFPPHMHGYGMMYPAPMMPFGQMPMAVPAHAPHVGHDQHRGEQGADGETQELEKDLGNLKVEEKTRSWAGLLKSPEDQDSSKEQGEQGEQADGAQNLAQNQRTGVDPRSWSFQVKESARRFQEAQMLFNWASYNGMDAFTALSLTYHLPQEIHNMILQGETLPPELEVVDMVAKHLRTICSLNFLSFVNIDQASPTRKDYFVIQCENEMEVFEYIKRSAWLVDNPESEELLDKSFGNVSGFGCVLIFFTIPSLRKLVGVAEMISVVLQVPDLDKKCISLRWMYIRDIPMHHLKSVNFLNNPQFRRQYTREDDSDQNVEKDGADETGAAESGQPEEKEASQEGTSSDSDAAQQQQQQVEEDGAPANQTPRRVYDGPRVYKVPGIIGDTAFEIVKKFSLNGGILLDYGEYAAAQQQNRAPIQANLICGGPRARTNTLSTHTRGRGRGMGPRFNSSSRGGGRGGRGGRGGYSQGYTASTQNSSEHGGRSRSDKPEDRGQDDRRGRGRGRGRGQDGGPKSGGDDRREGGQRGDGSGQRGNRGSRAGGAKPVSRKVEGSDGSLTLRGQYTFEIQHKKPSKSRKPASAPAENANSNAPSATDEASN